MSLYKGHNKIAGNNTTENIKSDLQNYILSFNDSGDVKNITSLDEITNSISSKSALSALVCNIKKALIFIGKAFTAHKGSGDHDGRYYTETEVDTKINSVKENLNNKLSTTGGYMSGPLNLANNTWNAVGDDAYFGDANYAGCMCIKGNNGNSGIAFFPYSGSHTYTIISDGQGTLHLNSGVNISGDCSIGGETYVVGMNFLHSVLPPYGIIFRNDGTAFYILLTNANDMYGTWNKLRPFNISLSDGTVWINGAVTTSDRNAKHDIVALDEKQATEFILNLSPVTFRFNNGVSKRKHWGLIAQDVESALKKCEIGTENFAGFIKSVTKSIDDPSIEKTEYGLRYEEFIAPLITIVQQHQKQIEELKEEIKKLKGE